MFSKKMLLIVGVVVLITVNIVVLFISSNRYPSHGFGRVALFLVAPIQDVFTDTTRFVRDVWRNYFAIVSAAQENQRLKKALRQAIAKSSQWREIELSNIRLRRLLDFQATITNRSIAAEVVGRDPSPWFKTIIINRGRAEGVTKGLPVVIPEGIVGQVTDVTSEYAKVMLIIDRNSAVDALVQRTRARGIIQGESTVNCIFKYVLRKDEVTVGDKIVASGFDGVFPKGFYIGEVSGVIRRAAGIFQEVTVVPYVDFEKLEEVLVILSPPKPELLKQP
jgi:rod shape-determining protein MreC